MSSLRIEHCLPRLRAALSSSLLIAVASCPFALAASVDPKVLAEAAANGSADAILALADQTRPLLAPLKTDGDYRVRRGALISALRARADRDQSGVRAWLDARGIAHRDFWIANLIQVRLPSAALAELAARGDIARIDPNPQIPLHLPPANPAAMPEVIEATEIATGIAWGVAKIEAPAVWSAGFTGQGVVIGGEDTGYQWDHPVLKPQYRGWNGANGGSQLQLARRDPRLHHQFVPQQLAGSMRRCGPRHGNCRYLCRRRWSCCNAAPSNRRRAGRPLDRLPQHGRRNRHAGALHRMHAVDAGSDRYE